MVGSDLNLGGWLAWVRRRTIKVVGNRTFKHEAPAGRPPFPPQLASNVVVAGQTGP